MQKKQDENDLEMAKMRDEQEQDREKIKTLVNDKILKDKEIKDRDDTINDKEKRIVELKKKNQELEKFKFVLDYRIKELRKQIEPKTLEIEAQKVTLGEMDKELERYNKINQAFQLETTNQQLKIDALQKEVAALNTQLGDADALNHRFRTDLEETVQYIQDYKMLKASVKLLYQRHCGEAVQNKKLDDDVQKEYSRQREYLERSVSNLKKKITKDAELHRYESNRFMNDNASLINEINSPRREVKQYKTQLDRAKNDLRQANSTGQGAAPPSSGGMRGGRIRPSTAGSSRSGAGGKSKVAGSRMINDEVDRLHGEIRGLLERNAELEIENTHLKESVQKAVMGGNQH